MERTSTCKKGILLSIDVIQPDAENETIYLLRDVFTVRILNAENKTDSTKERLKQILSPFVALNLPVIGVISDAQSTELQAVAEIWPNIPHQICQFHVIRDAGRLIYQADTRVRNDMCARMKQKTHEYRQNIHKRLKEAYAQEPFFRKRAPKGEKKEQRKKRERESQVWKRSVKQIGPVPPNHQWISVGDSGSDIYTFWQTCEDLGYDFAVRVAQDRVIEISPEDAPEDLDGRYLKTLARALPATSAHFLSIPAHEYQPKREVFLQMSFQKVRVQPPLHGDSLRKTDLTAWVIRVWETHPREGQEPLEWILLMTIPMMCPADAWEVVQWYRWRCCWRISTRHSRRAATSSSALCKTCWPSGNCWLYSPRSPCVCS